MRLTNPEPSMRASIQDTGLGASGLETQLNQFPFSKMHSLISLKGPSTYGCSLLAVNIFRCFVQSRIRLPSTQEPAPHRRKREVHLYLRDDVLKTLEQVSVDSDLSISRVVEILLGFFWEFNDVSERGRFLVEVNKRFRRNTEPQAEPLKTPSGTS